MSITDHVLTVPPLIVPEVEANQCLTDVERQVGKCGGKLVVGWRVAVRGPVAEAVHHCCWESPAGELYTITPQAIGETIVEGADYFAAIIEEIQFLPDPAATWIDVSEPGEPPFRVARPNRWVPLRDLPEIHNLCKFLKTSDQKFYTGDFPGGRYWNHKANNIAHKYGFHVENIPEIALPDRVRRRWLKAYDAFEAEEYKIIA